MHEQRPHDAIVVGSGPNGLAAAITLARNGLSVLVLEARDTVGGGVRTAELTLPGFLHDICSAIHPFAVASPFFSTLPLEKHGLEWIHPLAPIAHPLDNRAMILERSVSETAREMGRDENAYQRLMGPLVQSAPYLFADLLGPPRLPRHLLAAARFGLRALQSASGLARRHFATEEARAVFAGIAAHTALPLERISSAAAGLMLAIAAHAGGWPFPRGGAQRLAEALASYFRSLGGEIITSTTVKSVDDLPPARAVLLDVTPRQVIALAGHRLPARYCRALERYRYGPGVFKVDWALSAPIPWKAAACSRAGTVHLGGTLEEIAAAERAVSNGEASEKPYVLVAQHSLFDPSRAPPGKHTAWGYCHVPHGSAFDMTARIEAQLERYAPGFKDCILARHTFSPADLERYNANYIGGDIFGGIQDLKQLFARPVLRLVPYATPAAGLYICSSSTPPGPGVHGMCGYFAAKAALRKVFRMQGAT